MGPQIRGVYAVTPSTGDTTALLGLCRLALEGGVGALQLRNKGGRRDVRLEQAERLRELTSSFGTPLIVNDDVGTAARVRADGVHLGQSDIAVAEARSGMGEPMLIGVSCKNSVELALQAVGQGADYVSFGAIRPSPTKPGAVPCGLDVVRDARSRLPGTCIVAIGGVTERNAAEAAESGADAVAVCSGLFGAPDVKKAARRISEAFRDGQRQVG